MTMEDYIVLVSEKKLGIAPKLISHNATITLHLAFSIFLFDNHGNFLLQQRSYAKKTWRECGQKKKQKLFSKLLYSNLFSNI